MLQQVKRFSTSPNVIDTGLIILTVSTVRVSIATFVSGAGLRVEIELSENSLHFFVWNNKYRIRTYTKYPIKYLELVFLSTNVETTVLSTLTSQRCIGFFAA